MAVGHSPAAKLSTTRDRTANPTGEERDGKKGALVEGIVWLCDGGEMETYWDAYCRMIQIGDAEQGVKKPMLKLRIFEQRMRQLSLR